MAAPTPGYVWLPLDTTNNGKKMRTQTRLVGADTVHEHYFVPVSGRAKKVFHYAPPLQTVQPNTPVQDGIATAFFWLQNPSASLVNLIIRQIVLRFATGNVVTLTFPRILATKFTFVGTASGATVPLTPRITGDTNAADMRTAVTGMTVTLANPIASFLVPQMHAVGQAFAPPPQVWPAVPSQFEDDDVWLAPGEGVVLYQPDAGTASDPRRFTVGLRVEEVER